MSVKAAPARFPYYEHRTLAEVFAAQDGDKLPCFVAGVPHLCYENEAGQSVAGNEHPGPEHQQPIRGGRACL